MKRRYMLMWSMCGAAYSILVCCMIAVYSKKITANPHEIPQLPEHHRTDFVPTAQVYQGYYTIESASPPIESLPFEVQFMRAALRHAPSGTLVSVLDKAEQLYKDDPDAYLACITTQDEDGWMPLHHYIVDGDVDHIKYILHRVATFFKDDHERFATFLMTHDKQGQSPLLMSLRQHQFEITELIIEYAEEMFGDSKIDFFKFINKRDFGTGKTALLFAAYNNWLDVVQMLVESAARILGCKSTYFERFINAKDMYGRTSITYGNNSVDRILLPYGAQGEQFIGEVD